MTSIAVILVSVREGRRGEAFAKWILELFSERPNVRAELIDLKNWQFGAYTHGALATTAEKTYDPQSLEGRWAELVRSLDGFILVTPEYNRSYPGHLKNALDQLYVPWNRKPVAFVSYGGFASGGRSAVALTTVAVELRMVPIRDEVNLSLIGLATDERGFPTAELHKKRAVTLLDELLWWTTALKEARERHPH